MITIEMCIQNPFQRYMTWPWSENVKIEEFLCKITHNYANYAIIMHVTDTILFSCLPLTMRNASVKFQADPLSGCREKVEQTDRRTDGRTDGRTDEEKYNIDNNNNNLT